MFMLSESQAIVQTLETVHAPPWETLTHLKIYTPDYQPLSWEQVWQAFMDVYPERGAVEFFRRLKSWSMIPTFIICGCCRKGAHPRIP